MKFKDRLITVLLKRIKKTFDEKDLTYPSKELRFKIEAQGCCVGNVVGTAVIRCNRKKIWLHLISSMDGNFWWNCFTNEDDALSCSNAKVFLAKGRGYTSSDLLIYLVNHFVGVDCFSINVIGLLDDNP